MVREKILNTKKFNRGEAEVTRTEQMRAQDGSAPISFRKTVSFINLLFCLLAGLCFLFNSFPAYGSGGDILWQSGDAKTGKQESTAVVTDTSGNVIVTGYQNLSGDTNDDYYTVKFNGNGSGVLWAVPYDKAGGTDVATAIAVDSNGDIIVTGHVSNGLNSDIHTIKYSGLTGAVLWQHTYNGTSNGNDYGVSVAVDSLNNIYVAGYTQTASNSDDFIIIKYDSIYPEYPSVSVTPIWTEVFGATGTTSPDKATAITAGTGGIAVTGYSWNGSNFDYLTRKYGFDKTFIWERVYAGTASGDDRGLFVKMDAAGDVIVTGYAANSSNHDIYTVKYNGVSGAIAWEKTYDGSDEDEPAGLYVFSTGDVYVTGFTRSLTSRYRFYTVRYRGTTSGTTGEVIWEKTFTTGGDNDDIPTAIVADESGDIFVTGYTFKPLTGDRDFQTIKYKEEDGTQLWQFGFDGAAHKDERPVGVVLSPAGEPIVAGWSDRWTAGASDYDYYVIKYDPGLLNAPAELNATAITNTEVSLSWADHSDNEDGFDIWRKPGITTNDYEKIGSVLANDNDYSDTAGLVADNYYFYKVRAVNSTNGNSHFSNEAHVLTRVVIYDPADWSFIYNNPDNGDDIAKGIAVGPDDNPVVTGYSFSEIGTFDYYTVKLNRADGDDLWSERYDDPDSEQDDANCITVDNENNVIVSGFSSLYGGGEMNSNDIFTIKYPSGGSPEIWHDQYNGPAGGDDRATAIAARTDGSGNVAVVGYGHNLADNDDIYVLKYPKTPSFDEYGNANPMWAATPFDSGGNDYSTSVAFDSAGNVYVTGYSSNGLNYDCFIAKYDAATGDRLWTDIYNGAGSGNDRIEAVAVDSSDNVYITGYGVNVSGNEDFYTIKYNGATGAKIWGKSYDGPGHGNDEAVSVKIDPIDGSVVVAGTSLTSTGNNDFHIIRYSAADGSVIWEKNFERDDNDDYVSAMEVDASGYIYVAGISNSGANMDILSVIYDYEGNYLDAVLFNGAANSDDYATSLTVNYQGEAFIAGYSRNASGNADYVVLKQKHDFILIPAPLTLTPQADYSKILLEWRDNSPGTSFRIERTPAPSTPSSIWTPIYTAPPGTISYQDTGLNYGSGYCYRIDAFLGSLSSRKVEACSITTLHSPVWNYVTTVSTTQINLSWQNVTGNTGYKIERKTGAGAWGDLIALGAGVTTYSDTGLTAGTTYTYRVSTLSSSGYSSPNAEQAVMTLCSAPVLNTPTGMSTTGMTVSWGAVTGAASYTLQYKLLSTGTYANYGACTGITATSCPVTGLESGKQYYFRVTATNASGNSAWSNAVDGFTLPTAPAITSVTRPVCSSSGNSSTTATINWGDVSDETAYYLQYAYCYQSNYDPNNCATTSPYWNGWYGSTRPAQNATQTTFSMSAGYAYRFRISSTVNGGATYSAVSNEGPIWACMAPLTQNAIQPASDTSLTVSWGNIDGNTNYDVQRQTCTGACNGSTCAVGGGYATVRTAAYNDTSWTDTGLTQGESYSYKIRAYNTTNHAGLTAPTEVWSNEQCLATPPPAPETLTLSNVTTSQIQLNWENKGSGQYIGYEIQKAVTTQPDRPDLDSNTSYWGGWTTIAATPLADVDFENASTSWTGTVGTLTGVSFDPSVYFSGGKSLKLSATGTTLGRQQTVSVTAGAQYVLSGNIRTNLSSGMAQCDVYGTGIDSPGIAIASTDANNNDTWVFMTETVTIPAGTTSVYVRCFANGTPNGTANFDLIVLQKASMADPNNTTYTDTGLSAGYGYKYRVRALYNGSGLYTAYTAPVYTRTYPSALTQSAPVPNTTSQITVYWGNVNGDYGYDIRYALKSGDCPAAGDWGTAVSSGMNTTNRAITGLTAGAYYCIEVRACRAYGCSSANGYGEWSSVKEGQTLLSAPAQNNPSNFVTNAGTCVSSPNNSSSMDISWTDGTGGTPSGYQIQRKTGTGGTYAAIATPSASPYTDSGIKAGEYYCYQVYSKNSQNYYSAASTEKCARTTPCQPVVALTVPSPSQVTLSWPVVYGSTNYKIERKLGTDGTYSQITNKAQAYQELYCNQPYPYVGCTTLSPITTTYDDTNLTEGSTYCYQIKGYNSADNRDSAASAEQCTVTSDLAKPGLSGGAINSMSIQVNWTYDPGVCTPQPCRNDIDGVEVEVKLANGLWYLLETTDASNHTVVDRDGVNPGSRYVYRARAYKGADRSPYSDELSIITPAYMTGDNTCN